MSINEHNYEEWMVAFIDGELNTEEVKEFNNFIEKNPELKDELSAFESVQFIADADFVYDGKEALLKKSGAVVMLKKVWPLAAAILLMFAIYPFINKEETNKPIVVKENKVEKGTEKLVKEISAPSVVEKIEEESVVPIQKEVVAEDVKPQTSKNNNYTAAVPTYKKIVDMKSKDRSIKNKPLEKIQEEYADVPNMPKVVEEDKIEKIPESITLVQKPIKEDAVLQAKQTPVPMLMPAKDMTEISENDNALVIIDQVTHPNIYKKINTAVVAVENKIEKLKKLKRTPITVSIGKRKLFTLNN